MSTIKNDQISLYCNFNEIIKRPGTSFQSPALGQTHVRNPCHTLVFDQILFFLYLGFKRYKRKCNFHYVAIPMMTSLILKFEDFTKTRKSRYLHNETLFFLQIKKIHSLHFNGYFIAKNSFVAEVTWKYFDSFKG